MCGVEIKYDRDMAKTGNVYFETVEKSELANSAYIASRILRDDNIWLYTIGDYSALYLCAKNLLRRIYECERKPSGYRIVENGSRTSVGMLLAGFVCRAHSREGTAL